jgi:hypothetical protein
LNDAKSQPYDYGTLDKGLSGGSATHRYTPSGSHEHTTLSRETSCSKYQVETHFRILWEALKTKTPIWRIQICKSIISYRSDYTNIYIHIIRRSAERLDTITMDTHTSRALSKDYMYAWSIDFELARSADFEQAWSADLEHAWSKDIGYQKEFGQATNTHSEVQCGRCGG